MYYCNNYALAVLFCVVTMFVLFLVGLGLIIAAGEK